MSSKRLQIFNFFTKFSRNLSLHEYVGMNLLRDNQIHVASGFDAKTPEEAFEKSRDLKFKDFVVKAQVLAGGRGKGHFKEGLNSGIHFAQTADQVKKLAEKMIGKHLVTKQTGEQGLVCNRIYVCERLYTRKEFYIAFTLDRKFSGPVMIGSASGGVNIEETSESNPDLIKQMPIDLQKGLSIEKAREFLQQLHFNEDLIDDGASQLVNAYKLFITHDMTLLELNPFVETSDGQVCAIDCKIQIDDNALFRQNKLGDLRDFTQEKELDVKAAKTGINYIALDGNIGCLVNGAGLAMATLDIIKLHGGSPANFLDIGGGATIDQVFQAFEIILSDQSVKAILVNIFGGIMRCDIIAQGIIVAAKKLHIKVPIVVRLQGTNVTEARMLFVESKMRIIAIDDLEEASKMVVNLANIVQIAHEANIDVKFELPI